MADEYKIQVNDKTYMVGARPVIENASFSHEFGTEIREQVVDVDICFVFEIDDKTGIETYLPVDNFKDLLGENLEDLIDEVSEDYFDNRMSNAT